MTMKDTQSNVDDDTKGVEDDDVEDEDDKKHIEMKTAWNKGGRMTMTKTQR